MKKIHLLFALLLMASACSGPKTESLITFKQVDPLAKIFRESNYLPEFNEPAEVAAGEHATFQLAVRAGLPLNDLCIEVSEFKNEQGDTFNGITTGFVDYVRVGRQTPDRAKDALNSLSLYYPDPIRENQHWNVERDLTQPMWVTVNVPHSAKAGNYKAKFTVKGKLDNRDFNLQKELEIKVYPIVLEEPDLWITNHFSTSERNMKIQTEGKDVKSYTEEFWELVKEIAIKQKECYSNVIMINPLDDVHFTEENGKYSFDYTNFDKMVSIFYEAGALKMLEGGHIAGRCGNWVSQFEPYIMKKVDGKMQRVQMNLSNPETQNFYKQFIPDLYAHIKSKFPNVLYAQHIADEPIDCNIKSYVEIAKFIKSLCPEIKILEACHTHNLENTVDVWVPQLNFFRSGYKFYQERIAAGDDVWFYICLGPQGQYVNRFIEQPMLKSRLVYWLNFKYNSRGYLHWGFNRWEVKKSDDNPYAETSEINTEGGNVLPGGDAWMVYPNKGKLNSSLRFEAMRDGVTDYTLLRMLEKKNPELARELCRQVIYNWDHYDMDIIHFHQIRHQILEALSH